MCGISGVWSDPQKSGGEDRVLDIAASMSSVLTHRGPDDYGVWSDGQTLALAHQRLSIQDLSAHGHQPMLSSDERYVVVFNGEIYNFLELRLKLSQQGAEFSGHSDTEVLLAAIGLWGLEKALLSFNGMFAFALWDKQERTLTLAQDRVGKKPLYFGWSGTSFVFASELKAIREHPEFHSEINHDAVELYLTYNYVPAPHSIYQNIFKMPQGSYLCFDHSFFNRKASLLDSLASYWSPLAAAMTASASPFSGTFEQATDSLESMLHESTRLRMISDVPLGVLLSGGIDSSTVAAIAQSQSAKPVNTFSIGFSEDKNSEANAAKKIAAHLGTDHNELYVSGQDALECLPSMVDIYDEPFGDSSQIPTYIVSKLARSKVTVALTGDGGDELFYGYKRYLSAGKIWRSNEKIPYFLRALVAGAGLQLGRAFGLESKLVNHALGVKAKHPADLYLSRISKFAEPHRLVKNGRNPGLWSLDELKSLDLQDPALNMMLFDFTTYLTGDILVKVDRASMANSLELRNPILDHNIASFAWSLPFTHKYATGVDAGVNAGIGKRVLRNVLARHIPRELYDRPKQGFGSPTGDWIRGPLQEFAENLFDQKKMEEQGILNAPRVAALWQECRKNPKKVRSRIWSLLMFQAWMEKNTG